MTFFYDLNKKLKDVLDAPKSVHQNLNEGAVAEVSDKKLAAYQAKADKQIAAGQNVEKRTAGLLRTSHSARRNKGLDPHADTANLKNYPLGEDEMDEGLGSVVKKIGSGVKKVAGKALDTLGHGSDEDLIRDLQKKAGLPQHGKKGMAQPKEGVDKQKFAALAPPKDKITFADKIAGAKKEVDEMLGQVAADAMKKAVSGHGTNKKKATDEGWDDMMKDVERRRAKPAVGSVERGAKHDIEHTATGRRVTRRTDDQGISVGADDDSSADAPKRGRGRPKGTGKSMGAKGPSGKSKLMTKEGTGGDDLVKLAKVIASCKTPEQLEAARKMAKNFLNKHAGTDRGAMMGRDAAVADIDRKKKELSGEELEEKAVSKKQQKFMGMVHAAQKGEKPASKEVAKVAKEMPKKAAKDFASTKHKGLPEKAPKKEDGADKSAEKPKKKKEKTEEAGGSGTPTASSGFSFGKGIYDSINRELEEMIAESMNVSMNMNNDAHGGPTKSLTVTATDEDAEYLGKLLKMAGVGGDQGGCGCGTSPCSCGDQMDETYGDTTATENAPDYPTDTETSDDALQYSGGLNKPKSTGQTTVPVIASQEERQESYAEAEEDAIKRMMEMAGIKTEGKKVEEDDVEEGNKFTGNLAKARAAGKKEADLDGDGDMEKVQESIFALTNMWKEYKAK